MIEIVNATDGVVLTDKQVLKSGQSVFVRSKNNSVGNIYITIVALGTTSYEAIEPLTRKINLKLVIGAEEIKTLLDTIYIEKGETFNMEFSFDNNEAFTEYIFSKSIDDTVCKVPAEMIGTSRVLPIEAVGVGKTTIRMELSNGVYTLINIICYMTFEDFGVELPSANEPNSPVSQAIYTTDNAYDQTKVKTVSSAKLNINSTLYLTLLPYNVEEIGEGEYRYIYNKEALNPINLSQSFVSNDTSILKIDSTGYITCLKEGQVEIDCTVTVFVNAFDGSDTSKYGTVVKKHLNYKFIVDVIIPIQSFEIIGSSIKVYAYNKLSYYDQQKGAGTITLNIKILPSNATFNPQDIIWTADNTYFVPKGNVTPSGLSATFDCHLGTGHLTQETSVNVRLSANGRNYSSTKMVSIISPQKVNYINLHNVPDYTLDTKGNEIPYIYFDGRKGLFTLDNSINLGAECVPQNAYNTNVRYVVGKGLGEDPNPIIKVDEKGNIIPIANGYCYLYVVAEDWFTSEADYSDYENNVRVVAVKVADGKTKATAIDINSARELMEINTVDGLKLHYVIQDNLDMTNYSDFISFGLFEKVIEENNISITTLEKVPFTGSLDACYNVFGTATQYKINGLSIKNTKYVREDSASLYYASSLGNNYTLNFGLFAENQGELSNLICDVSSIMVETTGLDDKATTNFGVLAGVNSGLIENCEVNISNLSGNELYVKANTTFVNVGVITGQNKGFITKITQDDEDTYEIHDAFVNNCISDGVINVFVYSSTPKGETQKVSRNTIYVGGLVGKNATERVNVSQDEKYLAKAVIQTLQDSRNPLYKDGPYNYYSGNITFESEEMNVRGTININLDTATFVNPIGVGGICGYSDGEILNVASEITINALNTTAKYGAENVGGICGISNYSTIKGVYFSGTISGYNNVGGICGTFSGSMENAIVEFMDLVGDEVFGKTSITAMGNAGSLAGTAYSKTDDKSTITYSFARSYFVREMIADNYVGDLYVIIDKNAEQNVNVGGLVGYAENTQISLSYSYINMYIEDENMKGKIAGIVGYSENSVDIEDCYLRGLIYINNENKDTYTVSAISNNSLGFQASNFYSTCGVKFASFDNYDYVELNANGSELYSGIEDISQITGFNIWDIDNWEVEDYYNNELPYIMYNGKRMLNEPPTSITYDIKPSTIQSNSDLYKLNKFIRVDGQTILLFKYDNQDLDSYNLNKILDFTIPPYFIGGVAQFNDMATIRLTIKSSDTSIAQINSNGTLTLYGEGTVQITIASMLNKKAFANIYIVVMNVTTGFDIYKNNLFTETIGSSIDDRLLIKKGTNLEIYPYISGNSDIMIEYSVNSAIFYPIIFANSGEWVQKDLAKSCLDIAYSGTHVIQAINPGTTMVEAKLFVYINDSKVYLPYSKTFYAQSFEGLNDFTLSHSSFTGIIKDRYEFTAKVATDIVDRTEFTIEALIADNNGNTNKYIEYNDKKYKVSDILDVNIVTKTKSQTEVEYSVYVEINDDYKASDLFFETRNFIIRCKVDDGQNINYGIIQQLDVSITINPQDVSAVETMFFGGAEVVYDANLSNPMYNVAEVDTDVITAGEIGIFKVFIYPEFSQIKNVYIYAASTDGEFMSIQQVGLRHGTVPGQNTYFTLSPAPANYSTTVLDTVYQGLHASLVSNVRVTDSVIQSSDFDGYLYFRCLTGSDVSLGTIYTVYVRVETYNNTSAPIIKKTMLYAEERIGVTVFYEDSLNNSNFEFITSYN
ncbi:MAG: hypothetical protein IJW82_07975 [Clostridia bacterium]|nr:hypothetical protein [Clostridia bacterium]